jgi:hypothetical protein
MLKLYLAILALTLAGCATPPSSSQLVYTPEVRSESHADNQLFHDLLSSIGGVGFADQALYPDVKERTIVKIAVVVPGDGHVAEVEEWTISHGTAGAVTYRVTLTPDGRGETDFSVGKKK